MNSTSIDAEVLFRELRREAKSIPQDLVSKAREQSVYIKEKDSLCKYCICKGEKRPDNKK